MEARKENLTSFKVCRFCLAQGDTLTSLYEKRGTKNTVNLPLKILSCVSIEVFPSDKMPTYICARCKFFIDISYDFKHLCRQADEHILQYIQKATPLPTISWPQSLLKVFRLANKTPEVPLMKTVIEGGTTIHVTAQESDTDEEDDENVYNVKIADGSDEGSKSTRIKVITGADKQEKGKPKRGKGFPLAAKLSRHIQAHPEDRSFPCKYCNKSFVKSHHYTRHLRLKHRENIVRTCRGPFGESDQYRCEQCEDSFATQDELIYHSAIHATQNLICPLCQEKFDDVDAVTAHIKSHVNGTEFMCDLCELVFTSKEKLDVHISVAHDDELRSVPDLLQDDSSMEMDAEEDEEDGINVKELDDHMVVEIKKTNDFLLTQEDSEEKIENTNSEDSESEMALPDLATVVPLIPSKDSGKNTPENMPLAIFREATITKTVSSDKGETLTASILRKAEEVKKKVIQQPSLDPVADKKNLKAENSNTVGASDKSLRLLEKELQELKRTNTRSEVVKTPVKPLETSRIRRAQIHTSTPKTRTPVEEKKIQVAAKSPAVEKKIPERRVITKENKEPKEIKTNNVSVKEEKEREMKEKEAKEKEREVKEKEKESKEKEKEVKEKEKETKEKEREIKDKEVKEKVTPKSVVKSGSEKSHSEEPVRRSTRPSKIKDYAKMIRDRSQDSEDNDDSDDTDDEEYKEIDKSVEIRPKARRASVKTPAPKLTPSPGTPMPRKRGRPRKDAAATPAPKVRKELIENEEGETSEGEKQKKSKTTDVTEKDQDTSETTESNKTAEKPSSTLVSPTGQTLKKIPIKSLPPGVKAMPLPVSARAAGGELCEMQIGKKVVKVQKIVMTKAEVEAMTKKGLVEMKGGTMVLKQGIKIPSADSAGLLSSLTDDASKESPSIKATPSRCDFGEDA